MYSSLRAFSRSETGAIALLFMILFPLLILIGGLASDVALYNAQKRYVQSQADLAATSAARRLPDFIGARAAARDVVASNAQYGKLELAPQEVIFGSHSPDTGFTPHADQSNPTGASAVRVVVTSPFKPLLLSPVLPENAFDISRDAIGQQQAYVAFTLRNTLLSLDTRKSHLDGLLSALGLNVSLNVLGYQGLANARVDVNKLLGLVSLNVGADVLTFNDVLNLPVTLPSVLGILTNLGVLPPGLVPPSFPTGAAIRLGDILSLSPSLLHVKLGDVLPNISLNAFDLVMALVQLKADPNQRIGLGLGVNLSPLADVAVSLGLIRPPVIAIGSLFDTPKPTAKVSQVSVNVAANVLGDASGALLRLHADVQIAPAKAQIVTLNCEATQSADTLATFAAETGLVQIGLNVRLFDTAPGISDKDVKPTVLAGKAQTITIRHDQFRKPVPIKNPLSLTALVKSLADAIEDINNNMVDKLLGNNCKRDGLFGWLCSLIDALNAALKALLKVVAGLINAVGWLLDVLGVDKILSALLDLLGISVAQAELILDDYSCATRLVQ